MSRKRRLNIPGGICHVTQQCHSKSFDLADDPVKQQYLALAYQIAQADQVEVINFSIQDSHPHWLLRMPETADYTLSQFMHKLNTRFGKWFNRAFQRKGSFWADRFAAAWVESGSMHFFHLTRYIDRNPLERAANRISPAEYRWGSYHYLFRPETPYPVTFLNYLYRAHPDKTEVGAWQWYEAFANAADLDAEQRQSFFRQLGARLFLGSERFMQKGKAFYADSVKNLQTRGVSWIQLVRDYSQLFRPLTEPATS
jgi:REP element-mobilizing transposase RayT